MQERLGIISSCEIQTEDEQSIEIKEQSSEVPPSTTTPEELAIPNMPVSTPTSLPVETSTPSAIPISIHSSILVDSTPLNRSSSRCLSVNHSHRSVPLSASCYSSRSTASSTINNTINGSINDTASTTTHSASHSSLVANTFNQSMRIPPGSIPPSNPSNPLVSSYSSSTQPPITQPTSVPMPPPEIAEQPSPLEPSPATQVTISTLLGEIPDPMQQVFDQIGEEDIDVEYELGLPALGTTEIAPSNPSEERPPLPTVIPSNPVLSPPMQSFDHMSMVGNGLTSSSIPSYPSTTTAAATTTTTTSPYTTMEVDPNEMPGMDEISERTGEVDPTLSCMQLSPFDLEIAMPSMPEMSGMFMPIPNIDVFFSMDNPTRKEFICNIAGEISQLLHTIPVRLLEYKSIVIPRAASTPMQSKKPRTKFHSFCYVQQAWSCNVMICAIQLTSSND